MNLLIPTRHVFSLLFCLLLMGNGLPQNTVLDAEGQPIAIPDTPKVSLNYQSSSYINNAKPAEKRENDLSKAKTLNRQIYIANDPNCRWLNSRIKTLQKFSKQKFSHYHNEINRRLKEWRCLNCEGKGPSQADYARCLTN